MVHFAWFRNKCSFRVMAPHIYATAAFGNNDHIGECRAQHCLRYCERERREESKREKERERQRNVLRDSSAQNFIFALIGQWALRHLSFVSCSLLMQLLIPILHNVLTDFTFHCLVLYHFWNDSYNEIFDFSHKLHALVSNRRYWNVRMSINFDNMVWPSEWEIILKMHVHFYLIWWFIA